MALGLLRKWWPLGAVALLLALAALAAAHSSPRLKRVESPVGIEPSLPALEEPADVVTGGPTPTPESDGTAVPDWLLIVALGIGGALLAVLIGVMVWSLARDLTRRRRGAAMPGRRTRAATAEDVVAALDAGLVDLSDADRDPRRAVIACWLRLEQAAAAAGTPRQATDTPTDLVTRLLSSHHVSADLLAGFAEVYREARYGTHTVDERMRTQARGALERLRAELTAGATSE